MAGPYSNNPFAGYFGIFQHALSDPTVTSAAGGVQHYVWSEIRQRYAARGESLPQNSFQAVNQMLSLAGQHKRASGELAKSMLFRERTGIDQAVTAQMTAPNLNARPLDQQVGGAKHLVIYRALAYVGGEPELMTLSINVEHNLPQSLSALQAQVEEAAAFEISDYGYNYGGVATPVAIHSY